MNVSVERTSDSIKGGELLKKDSAPWKQLNHKKMSGLKDRT